MSHARSADRESRSAAIRRRLDYPVIDSDLHTIEHVPLLEEYILHYGGGQLVDAFRGLMRQGNRGDDWYSQTAEERQSKRTFRAPWWGLPSKNTLDLATVTLPRLLHERLPEQGTDFAIVFPNIALFPLHCRQEELRRPLTRSINHYHRDLYQPYSDRLTPVAAVPMHTPAEAVEELTFAKQELGLKVAVIPGAIRRPIKDISAKYPPAHHPDVARYAQWLDFYGLDSEYDYDPFWAKSIELGLVLTTHSGGQGWTGRSSISNFMFNHIGNFADASEALAKSLFFGGVTRRHSKLRLSMLEGGAAWGASVYFHLADRWEKRNRDAVHNYNPSLMDGDLLERLYAEYGPELTRGRKPSRQELIDSAFGVCLGTVPRTLEAKDLDDFALAGIERAEDIRDRFVPNFFFGTESDDGTVVAAFNDKLNPLSVKLNAIWSSDFGHWDVSDMMDSLAQTWALVERGVLEEADFKSLVFGNPYKLYTELNPDFFKGTAVESSLRRGAEAAE